MFGSVFCLVLLVLFTVVLARLAGVRDGPVTMPSLARERGSTQWQRSQTKRNNDCPNQFFHGVIYLSCLDLRDAAFANRLQPFRLMVKTRRRATYCTLNLRRLALKNGRSKI